MKLDKFVCEVLTQIQQGVSEAISNQEDMAGAKGVINPITGRGLSEAIMDGKQTARFDIAVVVTEEMSGEGGASVSIATVFSAKGGVGSAQHESNTSRVQFAIPFVPPFTRLQQDAAAEPGAGVPEESPFRGL